MSASRAFSVRRALRLVAGGRIRVPGLETAALRRPWLVRVALGLSCGALVAESSANPVYTFRGPPVQATTVLDAEETTRVYRITFQAQRLGPDKVRTTANASADYTGSIERKDRKPEVTAPLIDFTVDRAETSDGGTASVSTSVFTTLQSSASLAFEGDCEKFEAAPCEAVVFASFSRTDDGAAGGVITIAWTLTPRSSPEGDVEPDGAPLQLPWTVSVEEQ